MKMVNIGFRSTAGAGYFLAHAINRRTKHRAVDVRFITNYIRYPCMVHASDYTKDEIRRMVYKSDVVNFGITAKPLIEGLKIDPRKLEEKTVFVYYHGTQLRVKREKLTKENREVLPDHIPLVSTPDLLEYVEDGEWMPVCRPFSELKARYGLSRRDRGAVRSFSRKRSVIFIHPTTSVEKKGSKTFFRATTNVIRDRPKMRFIAVINTPWSICMRRIGEADVMLAGAALGVVSMTAVEASLFSIPVISKLTAESRGRYVEVAGEPPPFVSWSTDGELEDKIGVLAERADVRRMLGSQVHDYLKRFHDEEPVAARYMEIIKRRGKNG